MDQNEKRIREANLHFTIFAAALAAVCVLFYLATSGAIKPI